MDKTYVLDFASRLLGTDSPTGYTKKAIDLVADEAAALGYQTKRNNKGNLLIYVKGSSSEKTIGFCAHCDTLGLMVRSIKSNGMPYFPVLPHHMYIKTLRPENVRSMRWKSALTRL